MNADQVMLAQRLLKEGKSVRQASSAFSIHPAAFVWYSRAQLLNQATLPADDINIMLGLGLLAVPTNADPDDLHGMRWHLNTLRRGAHKAFSPLSKQCGQDRINSLAQSLREYGLDPPERVRSMRKRHNETAQRPNPRPSRNESLGFRSDRNSVT